MTKPNEITKEQVAGVILPNNLVRQTIAYLEADNDPMAVMLKQHYKHWLKTSEQSIGAGKRQHESLMSKRGTITSVDAIYVPESE